MLGRHDRLLRRGDYIWGSFLKPERVDGYVVGVNPGDRTDVLGRFSFSESSVDDAVGAAIRGAVVWRQGSVAQRAAVLRRFREALSRVQDPIATLITRETGKPHWEARQEVLAAMRAVDLLLEDGLPLLEARVLDEVEARSDYRPRGVVGVLTPYNMPLLIPTLYVASALLSGNTVVFKPSKFTPGVGQSVAEMLDRCRLPRGVFNLIQGSGAGIGQRLATHPGLDALVFAGSFGSAMAIRRATFERPELPTLYQCGGKGCALVLEDCDIERTVYEVIVGGYLTAGQRHNSTGRVIATRAVYDRLVSELQRRASGLRVGYGFDDDVFVGPVVSENFRTRYRRYGRNLLARGHTALLEAGNREVKGRRGFYVNPSLYEIDWHNGHGFLNEEPPGPTMLLYKVDDWEEGVALHNQLVYRLSTSIFMDPGNPIRRELVTRLKTGSLNLNRGTIGASLRLPSVGLGRSSNGIPAGIDLLRFLSTPRATLVETRPFDPTQVVPGVRWEAAEDIEDLSGELVPEPQLTSLAFRSLRAASSTRLPLLLFLLTACPKHDGWAPPALQRQAPPPGVVEYTRVMRAGELPLSDTTIRDTWNGPVLDGRTLLYDVETADVTDGGHDLIEVVRHFYGPEGYGYVGTIANGALTVWDPPQIVLPANPKVGATWEGVHRKGDETSVRSCEILASNLCDGGIVSVCDSQRGEVRILLRDHFCPGVGWSGFEALVLSPRNPDALRMWSERVVRDGTPLPEPPGE